MIDLIVVDSFGSTMFTVKIEIYKAVAMGDQIYAMIDHNDNYIGRAIKWEHFKASMDRAN